MRHIRQASGSYYCGQACVAMVSGETLEKVFKIIGKKECTSTKVLSKALKHLKMRSATRLMPIYGDIDRLPHTCILKVKLDWKKSNWHWVSKNGDMIHDTDTPKPVKMRDYIKIPGYSITSYLKVHV